MKNDSYVTVIKPPKGWLNINFKELWLYRELFFIFVWRDLKVRYKQTVIGVVWAILQPFLLMIVFSIFFGSLAKIPSDGVPYPIFVYSGLLFWTYFSTSLSSSTNSLVDNENIIKKIYFPRLVLSLSPTVTPLVDFFIAQIIMVGMLIYYHFTPTLIGLILLPFLVLISFLSASGLGLFLAAINVRYRDIRYALPFFIQTLMFITPVIYPSVLINEKYRWLLALNPMTGVIDTARAGIIGNKPIDFHLLIISIISAIILFVWGIFYFKKTEKFFADLA